MSNDLRKFYLNEMGIETWVRRDSNLNLAKLNQLKKLFANCQRCLLNLSRKESVFVKGQLNNDLMIILDEPYDNDQKHEILLAKMLSSIGLKIDNIYITDVTKCNAYSNNELENLDQKQSKTQLSKEISIIAPKLILVLGQLAGHFLLKTDLTLSNLRGNIYDYQGIKVLNSFSPKYLLNNKIDKKFAYNDLLLIKDLLSL